MSRAPALVVKLRRTRIMLKRLAVLFGYSLFAFIAIAGEKTPDQPTSLQGTWEIRELEANGEKKPADDVQGMKVIIQKDEFWLVKPSGTDPKLKFTLGGKNPRTIDLVVQEGKDKGKVVLGIYSLRDNQLRLCLNIFGDPKFRPSEFKTQQRDGVAFATLERVKDK
jgi:uncharacterized protein (TIGR03067 family)